MESRKYKKKNQELEEFHQSLKIHDKAMPIKISVFSIF